jgi:hypothetical protein
MCSFTHVHRFFINLNPILWGFPEEVTHSSSMFGVFHYKPTSYWGTSISFCLHLSTCHLLGVDPWRLSGDLSLAAATEQAIESGGEICGEYFIWRKLGLLFVDYYRFFMDFTWLLWLAPISLEKMDFVFIAMKNGPTRQSQINRI